MVTETKGIVKKTLPNNLVIAEVAKLLETQPAVILPVKGYSMLPFIIGSKESVELVLPREPLMRGHVVLAWVHVNDGPGHYVVHRIVKVDGKHLTLMGDGNISGTEQCTTDEVVAMATHVVDPKGGRHDLYSPWRLRLVHCWWWLLPVRRWILGVYRRTWLKVVMAGGDQTRDN